ncbi:hypothetical protein MIV044L [Invertebrate iridescent virus 3]|uniref:Putative serine/threonine-protein kinase 040L n=1 Tax=Invertebrate iridescent virus 3 TaxID=345201 RepID=044L_IIV3|nr:hypothetical protein MIV044L [Invertebrate iridescent virus 3]Q197B6.1 RecName: Full=Putative serine/threonine-protein kinase 040L [Invertebrate iridescent virus 3]ABF82074.1 hypothetical protein MIV044L [Invertebrate iridescent virus 3]
MPLSVFAEEFAEKSVKRYIGQGLWLPCNLSDYYYYQEFHDEGGYGSIHRVMDKATGNEVIMKHSYKLDFSPGILPEWWSKFGSLTDDLRERVVSNHQLRVSREAQILVQASTVLPEMKLHDYFDDGESFILIMDYGGRSLENIASSHKKKITNLVRYRAYKGNWFYKNWLKQVVDYMIKIYHKIKILYDIGIYHNDLKPENVLVDGDHITIIDFGVADFVPDENERKTWSCYDFRGTIDYIPPEVGTTGSFDPWHQTVWCFGVMLYFLSFMEYPFHIDNQFLEYALEGEKLDKLPEPFAQLIRECLSVDPDKRPLTSLLDRLTELHHHLQTIDVW